MFPPLILPRVPGLYTKKFGSFFGCQSTQSEVSSPTARFGTQGLTRLNPHREVGRGAGGDAPASEHLMPKPPFEHPVGYRESDLQHGGNSLWFPIFLSQSGWPQNNTLPYVVGVCKPPILRGAPCLWEGLLSFLFGLKMAANHLNPRNGSSEWEV